MLLFAKYLKLKTLSLKRFLNKSNNVSESNANRFAMKNPRWHSNEHFKTDFFSLPKAILLLAESKNRSRKARELKGYPIIINKNDRSLSKMNREEEWARERSWATIHIKKVHSGIFATIFVSLRNIKRSF